MPTTPSTLRYRKITHLGLSAQAINFAQSSFMGHRVSFNIPVDFMNEYFRWTRAAGELRPTGRFVEDPVTVSPSTTSIPSAMPTFVQLLERAFGTAYTDMDGVAEGLNYSSPALDSTSDMKRDTNIMNYTYTYAATGAGTQSVAPTGTHYSVNDLVMAFVLNKCFGSSAYDAWDIVYNLGDAFGMLSNSQLALAINASLAEEEAKAVIALTPPPASQLPGANKGRVDEMFRSLLSMDPQRFYKNGTQIAGLFETNVDADGEGNWCLGVGDKIEIPVRLYFRAPVTVLSVVDNAKNPSSATPDQVETIFIKGTTDPAFDAGNASDDELAEEAKNGNVMSLRLQILCSDPVMVPGVTRATSEDSAATPPAPSVATFVNPVFYDGPNYQTQTAIVIVYANLGSTAWALSTTTLANLTGVGGVTANLTGSVLQLTYSPSVGSVNMETIDIELEDPAGTATPPPAQSIKITISRAPQ